MSTRKLHVSLLLLLFEFSGSLLTKAPHWSLSRKSIHPYHSLSPSGLSTDCTIESYKHDECWKLTYIFKPASAGYEDYSPLLLVHPVGIGLSSWFWMKFIEECKVGPAIYAVDLIGCGLEHGADAWNPMDRGSFFPLSWTEGCETLISNVILPRFRQQLQLSSQSSLSNNRLRSLSESLSCIVITQGGVAPIGIMLAYRNPQTVSKLIMASPPKWMELIHPIPEIDLKRNYDFLSLPVVGSLLFKLLETRYAIRLFSNLFLFSNPCDERWLDFIVNSTSIEAREPIKAFNAGLINHRSYEHELHSLRQPTLILSGFKDKRYSDRIPFKKAMKNCSLGIIDGLNVLGWENAIEFKRIVFEFAFY